MGENMATCSGTVVPAWRENTRLSFATAAAAGANFVEFDVQVTRDGVPVIWHDDTLEYGDPNQPARATIADLTLAEFRALGALSAAPGGANDMLTVVRRFKVAATHTRSGSDGGAAAAPHARSAAALRWRCAADEPFPTLAEVFAALPESVGFDIEVKLATPNDLPVTPPQEIERMLSAILPVVERGAAAAPARPIVFSSFDPDMCAALRARQATCPVFFLSTGGRSAHADPRRTSVAAALDVAASAGLSGVILDSGALAAAPASVAVARGLGLTVLSYGLENDEPEWVAAQAALGVHGAIVDDVARVVAALRRDGRACGALAVAKAAPTAVAAAAAPGGEPLGGVNGKQVDAPRVAVAHTAQVAVQ